jgi:RimJ/RimL family protein N-acetyltransferase
MSNVTFRRANLSDVNLYYNWLNDPEVREKSYDSSIIKWQNHVNWFNEKINNPDYYFYIFQNNRLDYIGQVRIQKVNGMNSVIGVSVCIEQRGMGYGSIILIESCKDFFKLNNNFIINAYIKNNNISSKIIFEKAGFIFLENILYNNFNTDHYALYADRKL